MLHAHVQCCDVTPRQTKPKLRNNTRMFNFLFPFKIKFILLKETKELNQMNLVLKHDVHDIYFKNI